MRVKGGYVSRRRHKRLMKLSEGFLGRRRNCFKHAKRAVQKALQHAYKDRRHKKRDFRTLWIARINAASRFHGLTYNKLIAGLNRASIELDRKVLAELAVRDSSGFLRIVEQAKKALGA